MRGGEVRGHLAGLCVMLPGLDTDVDKAGFRPASKPGGRGRRSREREQTRPDDVQKLA